MYEPAFISDFSKVHLLVIGEIGIDEYILGECHRISPEAPVPVVEVCEELSKLGMAGNVAQNIVSLGGKVSLLSICGEDENRDRLKDMIIKAGIQDFELIGDPSRPTMRKVRVLVQKQHLVRVDYERLHGLSESLSNLFTEKIMERLEEVDGVIVEDYGKGLWNSKTMLFVSEAKRRGLPIFVDPSRWSSLSLYEGVTLLTPNLMEAESLCKMNPVLPYQSQRSKGWLKELCTRILKVTGCQHAIITCGKDGIVSLSQGEDELKEFPTLEKEVYDVTGAGDTVIAVVSMMYTLNHPLPLCLKAANVAAGIVVGKIGASTVSCEEFSSEWQRIYLQ